MLHCIFYIYSLENNEITGVIPSEFGNLDSLKSLNMACNTVNGSVLTEIQTMNSLEFLDLCKKKCFSKASYVPYLWKKV